MCCDFLSSNQAPTYSIARFSNILSVILAVPPTIHAVGRSCDKGSLITQQESDDFGDLDGSVQNHYLVVRKWLRTSSASARLGRGIRPTAASTLSFPTFSVEDRNIGVSMYPLGVISTELYLASGLMQSYGATALTLIVLLPISLAAVFVKPITPCLDAT